MDLVSLVRKRREQLAWTQSDLARAMGSSPSRVCKMESSDASVSPSLMWRALAVMDCPLRISIDAECDPFSQPGLTRDQRRELSARLLRRRRAEQIARRESVDPGDVEHALFNMTLPPWQRLRRSFQRAGLRRLSAQPR